MAARNEGSKGMDENALKLALGEIADGGSGDGIDVGVVEAASRRKRTGRLRLLTGALAGVLIVSVAGVLPGLTAAQQNVVTVEAGEGEDSSLYGVGAESLSLSDESTGSAESASSDSVNLFSDSSAASTASGGEKFSQSVEPIHAAGEAASALSETSGSSSAAGSTDANAPQVDDSSVIRTGSATLTVESPSATATELQNLARHYGGATDSVSVTEESDVESASGYVTVRVPAAKFDTFIADLEDLGSVDTVSIDAYDAGGEVRDLKAKRDALQTSVDRLEALMSEAGSLNDLLKSEKALTSRQQKLDALDSELSHLEDQIDLSTLSIQLRVPADAPEAEPQGFGDGVSEGWEALLGFGGSVLVGLGILLPWLLPIGALLLIALLVFVIVRRRRR